MRSVSVATGSSVDSKWGQFSYEDLRRIKEVLDDYCDRFEDTCEQEAYLSDEIHDELARRYDG